MDCQTTPNLVEIKQLLAAGQDSGLPVCGLYLSELASQGPEDLPVLATWLRVARSIHSWAAENLGLRLGRLHRCDHHPRQNIRTYIHTYST